MGKKKERGSGVKLKSPEDVTCKLVPVPSTELQITHIEEGVKEVYEEIKDAYKMIEACNDNLSAQGNILAVILKNVTALKKVETVHECHMKSILKRVDAMQKDVTRMRESNKAQYEEITQKLSKGGDTNKKKRGRIV
jgi:DNA repair ATPase RecN